MLWKAEKLEKEWHWKVLEIRMIGKDKERLKDLKEISQVQLNQKT